MKITGFWDVTPAVWWNCTDLLEEPAVPHDTLMAMAADFSDMSLLLHYNTRSIVTGNGYLQTH
jgi:hypothetical protein